jgi:hypothetical protein
VKSHALYAILGLWYLVSEISLLAVLFVRRQFRLFPVFTLSIAFNLFNNIASAGLIAYFPSFASIAPFALLPVEYLLDLAVLLEIAWNVLRPVHTSLPKGSIRALIVAVALAFGIGLLLAHHFGNSGKYEQLKAPFDLTVGMLRMLIFAATAGFAQLLGIGWRNKVLQLATGLSFYSAVDLIVSLAVHYYGDASGLEAVRVAATAFEFTFFVWVFTTKDVARKEFSPQMEQFLGTLAGRARLARTALVRMQVK